ncbi:hypothetical protein A4249_07580 [Brevundimonas sp. GW460-12-10-14-LB2]|nr:hypothetical protein A4249_07580 [Brevundimonas sp. GW460-12-10-14-LB2]
MIAFISRGNEILGALRLFEKRRILFRPKILFGSDAAHESVEHHDEGISLLEKLKANAGLFG